MGDYEVCIAIATAGFGATSESTRISTTLRRPAPVEDPSEFLLRGGWHRPLTLRLAERTNFDLHFSAYGVRHGHEHGRDRRRRGHEPAFVGQGLGASRFTRGAGGDGGHGGKSPNPSTIFERPPPPSAVCPIGLLSQTQPPPPPRLRAARSDPIINTCRQPTLFLLPSDISCPSRPCHPRHSPPAHSYLPRLAPPHYREPARTLDGHPGGPRPASRQRDGRAYTHISAPSAGHSPLIRTPPHLSATPCSTFAPPFFA